MVVCLSGQKIQNGRAKEQQKKTARNRYSHSRETGEEINAIQNPFYLPQPAIKLGQTLRHSVQAFSQWERFAQIEYDGSSATQAHFWNASFAFWKQTKAKMRNRSLPQRAGTDLCPVPNLLVLVTSVYHLCAGTVANKHTHTHTHTTATGSIRLVIVQF